MSQSGKPSIWFWVIGVFALLWNGMGVGAYFNQFLMSAEAFADLRPEQQDLIVSQPFWQTAAFAIAVFSGFIGSVLLLLRKRLAVRMFLLSLIAVIVQFGGLFLFFGYANILQGGEWFMPIMIPICAIGFNLYASKMEQDSILA